MGEKRVSKTTEPVIAKGWRYETNYNTEYGHYEESFEIRDTRVCMYDMMLNKDEKVYVVTHLDQNRIGLTAVLAETEPNELTVDKNYLYEYFVLIGSVFSEGKGLPT